MRSPAMLTILVVAAIVFAGCTSGQTAVKAAPTTAAPATVSADTGSIAGRVTDDQLQMIVGAQVAISGPADAAAETDAEGRFTFNDLAPGEYTVISQKLGYDSAAKKVPVEAGKAAEVSLILKPIAILTEPRQVQFQDEGFSSLSVYTFAVGVYDTAGKTFTRPIETGGRDIVSSMKWDSATPVTARYAWLDLKLNDGSNRTAGRSPITTKLADVEMEDDKEKFTITWRWAFACGLDANCFVNNPDALVPQIAYEQRTSIYTTVFYVEPAPDGYVAYPQ